MDTVYTGSLQTSNRPVGTNRLVKHFLAALAVTIVAALGARMCFKIGPKRGAGEGTMLPTPPSETRGQPAGGTDAGPSRSGGGGGYRHPVMEPLRGGSIAAPWKGRFPSDALVDAKDLANPQYANRVRILDACPQDQYRTRHIPKAVWIDFEAWSAAFAGNRERSDWEKGIGSLGIDVDTPVVIYDSGSGGESSHMRSILRYWGIKDVRLLNGGWPAWLYQGGRHETAVPRIEPRPCKLTPDPTALRQSAP